MPSHVSLTYTIWGMANATFGREVYKLWPLICADWEAALWHWNDEFGPLNVDQRAWACAKVCDSLEYAGRFSPDQRVARFRAALRSKLNHEEMRAGFQARASVSLESQHLPLVKEVPQ